MKKKAALNVHKSVIALILVAVLFMVLPILAQAAPVGKFTSVEGNVDVTVSGKPAAKANPGDSLNAGDIIRTKRKSKCEVVFIDGSVLRLAENSRLRVTEFAQTEGSRKATLDLFRGKVQNVVKAATGGASATSRYEVHTPTAVAGVRGTNFFSFYQGGVSGTVFKEGIGYGYSVNRPDDIKTIRPGQAMLVTNPNMPPTIRLATEKELNQHEKDTVPSEKPKEKGEKEQDKKPKDDGGTVDKGNDEGQPKEKESETADKKGEPQEGGEGPASEPPAAPEARGGDVEGTATIGEGPAGSDEKIIEASFQADLNENPEMADIIPPQESLPPVADIGSNLREIVEKDLVQETQQVDALAPIIGITPVNFSPATTFTNQHTAKFTVSATDDISNPDKIALSYSLDGAVVESPDIRQQLSEGNHIFTVTATDEAQKSATKSFAWTTDYTPPEGVLLPQSLPKKVAGADNHFDFTATDLHLRGSYCRIDAGEWVAFDGGQLSLGEGMKHIEFKAVDLAGNESPVSSYDWFIGANHVILQDAGGGFSGGVTVDGALAGAVQETSEGLRTTTDGSAGGWLMQYGGLYETTPPSTFNAMAGGLGTIPGSEVDDGFWLSRTDNASALAGGISGSSSFTRLSRTLLGTGTGTLTGTYENGAWQATDLGLGTYRETPLLWSGDWTGIPEGSLNPASLYRNSYDTVNRKSAMEFVAHDVGLTGGLEPFWTGPSQMTAMGTLMNADYSASLSGDLVDGDFLMNSGVFAQSLSGNTDDATSIFIPDAEFTGMTAGLWKDGLINGSLYAIYKTADGKAGWLNGNVDGFSNSAIGMWKIEGDLTPTQRISDLPTTNLDVYHSFGWGLFGGAFADGQGKIQNGSSLLQTTFYGEESYDEQRAENMVVPLRWGVYDLRAVEGNYFSGKPSGAVSSRVKAGGILSPNPEIMPEGLVIPQQSTTTGYGYWLADIDGQWSADGAISGDVANGTYLTATDLGTLSGQFFGLYTETEPGAGSWIGESVGTWEGEALAWSGSWGGYGSLYYNQDGNAVYAGYENGLMGGLAAPWSGETSFVAMGSYFLNDPEVSSLTHYLWNTSIAGGDIATDALSIPASFFRGRTAGIWTEPADGVVEGELMAGGALRALYYHDGTAGIISSDDVGGSNFPGGMWMAEGTLTATPLKTELAAVPVEGYGSISGKLSGGFDESETSGIANETSTVSYNSNSLNYFTADDRRLPWGIYSIILGNAGVYGGKPAGSAAWSSVVGGNFNLDGSNGYWLAGANGLWNDAGEITGSLGGRYLTANEMGLLGGPFYGVNPGEVSGTGAWIGESIGQYEGKELLFGNSFRAYRAITSDSVTVKTEYNGFMGGVDSLWSSSVPLPLAEEDYGVPVAVLGTYIHEQSDRVWDTEISGVGYDNGLVSHAGTDVPGKYSGFAGGIMTAGTSSDTLEGDMIALYIDPAGNAGYLKAHGSLAGEAYSSIGMFSMEGNLVREEVTANIGIPQEDFSISIYNGYAAGESKGAIGAEGWLKSDGSIDFDSLSFVNETTKVVQNWGIFKLDDYGTFANPGSANVWTAVFGGDGVFGQYTGIDSYDAKTLNFDQGYWIGGVKDGVWANGVITGALDGRFVTYTKSGFVEGDLLGAYNDEASTWEAVSLGTWSGTPSDFGGYWSHSLLYDNAGQLEWSCGNEGAFAFIQRTDGNYNFIAVGEYDDPGYGAEGFGGPYIWSGSIDYYPPIENQRKYISGFTGGIWKKNPAVSGAAPDSFGGMDGAMAGLYYLPDGQVGLVRGDLAGNFFETSYDEVCGMWQFESVEDGLARIDKTLSVPEDFDVAAAMIDYDNSGFTAYANGSFIAGSTATGNIVGESYSGRTEFITWGDGASYFGSLPFGTYNLRMGGSGESSGNAYVGKPADSSVVWNAKIGGDGFFGYDGESSTPGFWLAGISGTWDEYSSGAGHGTISGGLGGYYLDSTRLGTIDGKVFGLYTDELYNGVATGNGTWTASSLGTWEGDALCHVTPVSASLTGTSRYYEGQYNYVDGGYYSFNYLSDNRSGYIHYERPANEADPDGEYYDISYNVDGTYSRYDYTTYETSYGRWDGDYASLAFLGTPLDEASNPVLVFSSDRVDLWNDGYITSALMGGTNSLWGATEATPAGVTMIGQYTSGNTSSETWGTTIGSYNYKDGSSTMYDGGSYRGYLVGTVAGEAMESHFLGLYLDPPASGLSNAGVIRGSMTGELYPSIGMFAMDGGMYPESPVVSGIGISPAELASYAVETTLSSYPSGKLSTVLGATGKIWTDNLSLSTMSLVKDGVAQPWGIYRQDISGRYLPDENGDPSLSGMAGGAGTFGYFVNSSSYADYGYWFGDVVGSSWDSGKFAGALNNGRYITETRLGSLGGDLFGVYNASDSTWQGFGLGTWGGAELKFVSDVYVYDPLGYYLEMLLGGTGSLWTGENVAFTGIGSFSGGDGVWNAPVNSWNFKNNTSTTYDGGAYRGFIGLTMDTVWDVDGGMIAIYMDSNDKVGYLNGTLNSGNAYESVGMFSIDGVVNRLEIGAAPTGLTAENLYGGIAETGFRPFTPSDSGSNPALTFMQENEAGIVSPNPTWAIWQARMEGSVNQTAGPDQWSWVSAYGDEVLWSNYHDVQWNSTDATVKGSVAGAKVEWVSASTWVNGGTIKGVFDPNEATIKPWRAIAQGAMIETKAFMDKLGLINTEVDETKRTAALQAFYDATKIPCFQVGSTDLRGSGGVTGGAINLGSASDPSRGIMNATFLAPSTGGMPQIWASGSVAGAFTGSPTGGTVALSGYAPGSTGAGNGITANFNIRQFNTATWAATVTNGAAPVNSLTGATGATVNTALTFTGGAAGKVDAANGTFTGTAAGVVAAAPAP